ncbi:MAG: DUF4835 family protein [Saprospiraceae bacterium]|nr:DUF4835 family protein [Saprospiraceae bacterium]
MLPRTGLALHRKQPQPLLARGKHPFSKDAPLPPDDLRLPPSGTRHHARGRQRGQGNHDPIAETLEAVNRTYPNSRILRCFPTPKSDEIYRNLPRRCHHKKNTITRTMERIDPTRASQYRQGIGK